MGNTKSHRMFDNADVLGIIFEKLDLRDQVKLSQTNPVIHDFIVENLNNRLAIAESSLQLYEYDDFQEYLKKYGTSLRRLRIMGSSEFFTWKPFSNLCNLSELSIKNVTMYAEDIKWIIDNCQTLQCLKLIDVEFVRHHNFVGFNYDFNIKSIKKLQLPYAIKLKGLIENSTRLEELTVVGAPKSFLRSLPKHGLFSSKLLQLQFEFLENKFKTDEYSPTLGYSITMKKTAESSQVAVENMTIHCTNLFAHNLKAAAQYLKNIKMLTLHEPNSSLLAIFAENCQQLHVLNVDHISKGINLDQFKTVTSLRLTDGSISQKEAHAILQNLNLQTLRLERMTYREEGEESNPILFPLDFKSGLKQLFILFNSKIFEKVFAPYPWVFKNLNQLTFFEIEETKNTLRLLAENLDWSIKHIVFKRCTMELPEQPENLIELRFQHLALYDCVCYNEEFSKYVMEFKSVKYLTIYNTFLKADVLNRNVFSQSLRHIEMDHSALRWNKNLWYNCLEQCQHSLRLLIYDADTSFLNELSLNSVVSGKIKSIEYQNIDKRVTIDDHLFSMLPLSVTQLNPHEFLMSNYSFGKYSSLTSVLIIEF